MHIEKLTNMRSKRKPTFSQSNLYIYKNWLSQKAWSKISKKRLGDRLYCVLPANILFLDIIEMNILWETDYKCRNVKSFVPWLMSTVPSPYNIMFRVH